MIKPPGGTGGRPTPPGPGGGRRIPPPGVCELWVAPAAAFTADPRRLDPLLMPAERAQARRFLRDRDRTRFRLSRSLLRLLLAWYLGLEPDRVAVDRRCAACARPHGKPRLAAHPGGGRPLELSVAHAEDLLVFAFQATPVGVDLEAVTGDGRPAVPEEPELAGLAELALTPAERRRLAEAPAADRWRVFLRYWTRKEAVLKQLGTGLSVPLDDLMTGPDGHVDVRAAGRDGAAVWTTDFDLGDTHVGAVASATPAAALRIAEVPPSVAAALARHPCPLR